MGHQVHNFRLYNNVFFQFGAEDVNQAIRTLDVMISHVEEILNNQVPGNNQRTNTGNRPIGFGTNPKYPTVQEVITTYVHGDSPRTSLIMVHLSPSASGNPNLLTFNVPKGDNVLGCLCKARRQLDADRLVKKWLALPPDHINYKPTQEDITE